MTEPTSGMNGYEFAASIVRSLASLGWPAAAAWGVWLFRVRLTDLLPQLRLKRGEWEAYFDSRLAQAKEEAQQIPAETNLTPNDNPKEIALKNKRYLDIASISPRAAILEMRANVEEAFRGLATALKIPGAVSKPYITLIQELRSMNALPKHHYALLRNLRSVGNAAAHNIEPNITVDDALRYGEVAESAINAISGLILLTTNKGNLPAPTDPSSE